ncbi:unnamed protein product, partial [Prorocentrum cordatum]
ARLARAGHPSLRDRLPLARLARLLALPGSGGGLALLAGYGARVDGAAAELPCREGPGSVEALEEAVRTWPGPDPLLVAKHAWLGLSRADIVLGLADPEAVGGDGAGALRESWRSRGQRRRRRRRRRMRRRMSRTRSRSQWPARSRCGERDGVIAGAA